MQWSASQPGYHPCGFLSMYFCLEVKEFGSGMSKWWQPPALRQQRCVNYYGIKRPSNQHALFLVHHFVSLLFFLLEFDCWSTLYKVCHFTQTFRVRVSAYKYLSLDLGWSPKLDGTCFLDLDGLQSKLMDMSWTADPEARTVKTLMFITLSPFLAPNK